MSLLKTVLLFLINQAVRFIHMVKVAPIFPRIYVYHFFYDDFKIQVKLRGGVHFLCLALFVNIWQK